MSLFGDDEGTPSTRSKQTGMFDDTPAPATRNSSSLFADDNADGSDSPWAMPTPKKGARTSVVKSLLPADEVPESYIDAYDALLAAQDGPNSGLDKTAVKKLLNDSGIDGEEQARIMGIVLPSGSDAEAWLGRPEFNVLLALIGLAQEGEDATLDGVDERRRNLPEPSLKSIHSANPKETSDSPQVSAGISKPATPPPKQPANSSTPSRSRASRNESFGYPESDPWGSPEMHKGHNHGSQAGQASQGNGALSTNTMSGRTTSSYTTNSQRGESAPSGNGGTNRGTGTGTESWSSYRDSGLDEGFGDPSNNDGGEGSGAGGLGRSLGGGAVTTNGVEEVITVAAIPEKEGVFLFQHRNYQVTSVRRNSKVVRRYSDFVWLLDCLHKRYPFRQLPLLPPKRVAINGNHIAADNHFLEKRRRGLARFTNALVRHPVLGQEQLVIMFLTVPTELAVWRKQASVSVQEEFAGKSLPPNLEDSLPPNLQETFDTVRTGVKRSSEIYINLCNTIERLIRRSEGVAAEYMRVSNALQSLADCSRDTYAVDTNDVPLLNEGLNATAKHLTSGHSLLTDEARASDEGVLEDMKRQRDCLVSVRDMFDRRDRYDRDNIPQLEKRIENNETKLAAIRAKPEQRPGEAEKVEDAILKDKQSIVSQHARGVFIKECIRDELVYFQQSQYHVSRMHQDWSQERVKYAELQADNWRALSEEVEGMPLGE